MKADSFAEITDAKRIEMKSGLTDPGEYHRPCRCRFIIPACVPIGLGVGLLMDHAGSGFLIWLGLGVLGSGLFPVVMKPLESE